MTPKEKANKFGTKTKYCNECALIAVEELIQATQYYSFVYNSIPEETREFWIEVKEEILRM